MVHSFFGPSTHTTIWFFMQEYMSVLVVTNHHAGLISWPVGPTERWTLKLSCAKASIQEEEGKGRHARWGQACMEAVVSAVRECRCPRQHPHWSRGYASSLYQSMHSLCQQLPQSSRLMQSWALIVFLTSICITVWLGPGCTDALPIDGVQFLYYPLFLAFYS